MLTEWHLTPEYINEHWTDEELACMVRARGERLQVSQTPVENKTTPSKRLITDVELFKKMKITVTKR